MSIFQPSNQIRLTNVSVIRYKKSGKRFEIACYKNKVMEWRNGIETDLDNVLQTQTIFTNVSKGQLANKEDLDKAFNSLSEQEILMEILRKGVLQVSSLERNHQLNTLYRDIATLIVEKTVNPETKFPYTVATIEQCMSDLHYSVHSQKSAKQQALDVIKQFQTQNIIPIARARMKLNVTMPSKDAKRIKDKLHGLISVMEEEEWTSESYSVSCLIDPGQFRALSDLVVQESRGSGKVDVISFNETND